MKSPFPIDENVAKGHICAFLADALHGEDAQMGKRGPSSFKKLDVARAVRASRAAGFEPGMIEIQTRDGGVIRVYGDKAAAETTREVMSAAEWDEAIAKLKAKTPPKGGR
jgi:hypothetical protein